MRLFIAEKPSLGRAIADVLPKPLKKEEGCIRAANGDVVSWCFGHLLELAEPSEYDPRFKQWNLQHLPIVPSEWKMQAKPKTRKQIALLRKLCKEAEELVHAGDPDREGQLLVDEVIDFLKLPQYKRQSMKRCLISDLNPSAVKKAIAQLRDNREFIPLSVSALARSRADWLYGINLTRAYTLQGQSAGYQGVLSVGRVQTPVLGLVVRRDQAIDDFKAKPFYEVLARLKTDTEERFKVKWQPSEACQKWQDEEGRVLSRPLVENVAGRITAKPCEVAAVEKKPKKAGASLPYNLSALQIDANKRFALNAQQVLDTCQSLYEKHKLITYPRSDCRYLPQGHFAEGAQVSSAVFKHCPQFQQHQRLIDLNKKGKAWNDRKVEAHHAIIPTSKTVDFSRLNKTEQQVYELVARQYLIQFMPDHRYSETRVEVLIEGGRFTASAKQVLDVGWKVLFGKKEGEDDQAQLPNLTVGQTLYCEEGEVIDKETQPPKPFTDATLLAAMTGIARFVEDADVKKVLKETDGLGTEATRAGIIELLFKRGFLQRQGKTIRSTEAGRALINSLPDNASKPDMTARWEASLNDISEQKLNYQTFMQPLTDEISSMIQKASSMDVQLLRNIKQQPKPAYKKTRRRKAKPKAKAKA
ncbi:DNA topoisomerase III [Neptuniibacter sp. QD29_5]|uniref:DNA topoisomerase III n=1 Tax=Neptuniibacter sp. QD29_5 TaxID=3398207 RepID=UPI0039F5351C